MVEKLLTRTWDTEFFGFPVGEVFCNSITTEEYSQLLQQVKEAHFHLTYIHETDAENNNSALASDLPVLDRKTWYHKQLTVKDITNDTLESVLHQEPSEKLINLALQSGEFSRFRKDSRIPQEKFEEMYGIWLQKSVSEEKAWQVLITGTPHNPTGFVSLECINNKASLGLLAVDQHSRGKGLGKKLMQCAINASWQAGFKEMEIVTQGENLAACRLYETFGFQVRKIENIYHLWSNLNQT